MAPKPSKTKVCTHPKTQDIYSLHDEKCDVRTIFWRVRTPFSYKIIRITFVENCLSYFCYNGKDQLSRWLSSKRCRALAFFLWARVVILWIGVELDLYFPIPIKPSAQLDLHLLYLVLRSIKVLYSTKIVFWYLGRYGRHRTTRRQRSTGSTSM